MGNKESQVIEIPPNTENDTSDYGRLVFDLKLILYNNIRNKHTRQNIMNEFETTLKTKYGKLFIEKRPTIIKSLKENVWKKRNGENIEGKCYCCDNKITFDAFECGHITAFAEGGETNVDNLEAICKKCNRSMGKLNLEEYKKLLVMGNEEKHCDICNVTIKSFNWEKHINSKGHQKKAAI